MGINRFAPVFVAFCFIYAPPASGQESEGPLSAIGWLSDVVTSPDGTSDQPPVPDVARTATVSPVTTTPLGQTRLDAVGILPRSVTGLPADFWSRSSATVLAASIRDLRTDLPPPLAQFLTRLLLAELPAPADSTEGAELFLARVDKFLELGALDQAEALLGRAGPTHPAVFGRWFDVNLLTGREDRACAALKQAADIAPAPAAQTYCLARNGDWQAASATLDQAQTENAISQKESDLLARFLDPELFEGAPLLPIPDRITPLNFRLHEAIGEALSPAGLPNAFSYAELSERTGWKARIAAAERLTRAGAIPHQQLFALYSERKPAASGGVWDRVAAVQSFEAALAQSDAKAVSFELPIAMRAMRSAGLEYAFAQSFGPSVAALPMPKGVKRDALRVGLLSKDYERVAMLDLSEAGPAFWAAVAKGGTAAQESQDPIESAVIAGFTSESVPPEFAPLIEQRRLGEVALKAIALMADGARTDPIDIERGLSMLRRLGFEGVARETALFILLTRPRA